jgi:hypothetical protein
MSTSPSVYVSHLIGSSWNGEQRSHREESPGIQAVRVRHVITGPLCCRPAGSLGRGGDEWQVLAALVSSFVGTLLYGIGSNDPATYLAAVSLLIAVAFLACLSPGRHAMAIGPVQALHDQ